jgi:hypothetical protein
MWFLACDPMSFGALHGVTENKTITVSLNEWHTVCPQNAPWQGYNQINIYHCSALSSPCLQQMSLAYALLSASMLQIDQMAAGLLGIQVSSLAPCTNSSTNQPNTILDNFSYLYMYGDLLWARWFGDQDPNGSNSLCTCPQWPHHPPDHIYRG